MIGKRVYLTWQYPEGRGFHCFDVPVEDKLVHHLIQHVLVHTDTRFVQLLYRRDIGAVAEQVVYFEEVR